MFEDKLVEILTKASIGDAKEVPIRALISRVGYIDDDLNNADIDRIAAARDFKEDVDI